MPTWVYEARDRAGQTVKGAREGADRQSVLESLRAEGLFLTKLETGRATAPREVPKMAPPETRTSRPPIPPTTHVPPNPNSAAAPIPPRPLVRASDKELSLFFRQMAAMLHAGTSLGHALTSLSKNAAGAGLRQAAREMEPLIMSGTPISVAMAAYPGLFTPLHLGMIKAGERGGFLEQMFARLSQYAERDYELQQVVKRETWYPKMVLIASILIPGIVPSVIAFLQGGGNPFLIWFQTNLPPLLLIAAIVYLYKAFKFGSPLVAQAGAPRQIFDSLKLSLPIIGKVTRALATAKFCRALGALYGAGVSPSESVHLSAAACGNAAIAQSAIAIIPKLEAGEPLTQSLRSTGRFPDMALQMMSVGEESGNLDGQLEKTADFLESDAETAIKQSVQFIGVAALIFAGIRVAMIIGKFYIGYFDSIFNMAGG